MASILSDLPLYLVFVIGVCGQTQILMAADTTDAVTIPTCIGRVHLEKDHHLAGEPIRAELIFENHSTNEVAIVDARPFGLTIPFEVKRSDGNLADLTNQGQKEKSAIHRSVMYPTVPPNSSKTNIVLLTRYFDMTVAGAYTAEAHWTLRGGETINSGPVQVQVNEPNLTGEFKH